VSLAQRVLATTLPSVRTILLIMTIVGGLLALMAAIWVAKRSSSKRWRKRNLARLADENVRDLKLHSLAYQAYGNQRAERTRTGQGPVPVKPFGGMDEQAHLDQVNDEYFRRIQARTGRDPMQPENDQDVHREVLDELFWPALLAGLGVVVSTTASALSLYLPPDL
jgi:FtsZ-interacting cell division protein ZipA